MADDLLTQAGQAVPKAANMSVPYILLFIALVLVIAFVGYIVFMRRRYNIPVIILKKTNNGLIVKYDTAWFQLDRKTGRRLLHLRKINISLANIDPIRESTANGILILTQFAATIFKPADDITLRNTEYEPAQPDQKRNVINTLIPHIKPLDVQINVTNPKFIATLGEDLEFGIRHLNRAFEKRKEKNWWKENAGMLVGAGLVLCCLIFVWLIMGDSYKANQTLVQGMDSALQHFVTGLKDVYTAQTIQPTPPPNIQR